LGVVDHQGRQIAYAGPLELTGVNYSSAKWFEQAISNPFFISDVFKGMRGAPHFIVSVRQEHNGKPWILRATIDFGEFNNLVEFLRIGETGFAFHTECCGPVSDQTHRQCRYRCLIGF
jgi:two-component system NtrC family sensor kinase